MNFISHQIVPFIVKYFTRLIILKKNQVPFQRNFVILQGLLGQLATRLLQKTFATFGAQIQ